MIKKFKIFESNKFLSDDDIIDLFIELLDIGYKIHFYESKNGRYFFEFKKTPSIDKFGYVSNGSVYGYVNIQEIKKEMDSLLDILQESKDILESMGYVIAFEFEFNIMMDANMNIICHMKHSKLKNNDWV